MLLNNDEHRIKMDKIYADAEEFMDKEYGSPLNDEEVILLHGLFERAKRDDKFKDGLKDIRLTDIKYESIFAMFRIMDGKRGGADGK